MRLYLSGGGNGEKSAELDRKFASAIGKSKPLCIFQLPWTKIDIRILNVFNG